MSDHDDVFDDRVLGARDVCSNCFRLVRVERVDPTRGGLTREYEASYEREKVNTSIEYAPAETVSEQKGVFCACGVESARERIWDDGDVDRERLATLLTQLLRTLRRKGLSIATRPAARTARDIFAAEGDVDAALRAGVSAGLRATQPATDGADPELTV